MAFSSSEWGDYDEDGDGDLDLALTGHNGGDKSLIYRNEGGGTFSEVGVGLTDVFEIGSTDHLDVRLGCSPSVPASDLWIRQNQWTFVGVVHQAGFEEYTHYKNGQSQTVPGPVWGNGKSNAKVIGAIENKEVDPVTEFPGKVDEARTYDHALTESEVQQLYSGDFLAAPINFSAAPENGQVDLTWNAGGGISPTGYNVYRSTSSFDDISNATKLTSYTDIEVTNGTEYFYRVTAVDSDGNESGLSSETNAILHGTGPPGETALAFDGDGDNVAIPSSSDINLSERSQRTIEAFFKVSDKTIGGRKQVVWEEGGIDNGFNIYVYDGSLYIGAWSETLDWNGGWLETSAIESDRWHHVALMFNADAGVFEGYLDGAKFGSVSPPSLVDNHQNSIGIGANRGGTKFHDGDSGSQSANEFEGRIDEVRIWNAPRTASQIQNNRGTLLTGDENGLAAYWSLEDEGGSTAMDQTGNGHDGTVNGATWVSLLNEPTARFSFDPGVPTEGETVTFDASGSSDPDGQVQSYEWDFNDDGQAEATGQTASTSFSSAGDKPVRLTVEDDDGATDKTTATVSVNAVPTAAFEATPSVPQVGQEVTFDASGSSDPDGQVQSYEWDFNDDGQAEATGQTASTSFSSAGDKPVALTVEDDDGATDETTATVSVNAVPTATFEATPSVPRGGQEVTFDASGSSDPDGQIQSYQWTFGDGTSGSGPEPTHTYQEVGTYTAGLTVTDSDGAVSEEVTSEIQVRPGQMQARATQSFGGSQKEDYRLVALPGQANTTLSETAGGDWRGFRETGASGSQAYSRSECSGGCRFGPGTGFWLIAGQTWQVDRTVQTVDLNEESSVQISLQDGWNLVSNPLETEVSWSAVQQATGTEQPLWRWSGTWQQAQTFASAKEGEAYYFRDDQISALTVPYPGAGGSSTQGMPQAKADTARVEEGERRALTLSVVRGGETVTSVTAGVLPEAKPGLDRYDLYGPPGYFGRVTLRAIQGEEERPTALAAEYQGPGEEGYSFDLRLRATADTALTLRAAGFGSLRAEKATLVEAATGEAHALQEMEKITILQRAAEARYRLLIGSESYVEAKKENIRPSEVKLLPNYPNPFARQTTIEYALPEARRVRLAVYDVLGRRVATLADGRKEGGFHRLQWTAGQELSSGTYFLRLRAGGQGKTRRLTIVR